MENQQVPNNFCCQTCGKTFSTKKSLITHREVQHPSNAYECYICDKGFAKKSSLYTHKYLDHMQRTTFTCHCGKKFKRKTCLNVHQKSCGKKSSSLKSLNLCNGRIFFGLTNPCLLFTGPQPVTFLALSCKFSIPYIVV